MLCRLWWSYFENGATATQLLTMTAALAALGFDVIFLVLQTVLGHSPFKHAVAALVLTVLWLVGEFIAAVRISKKGHVASYDPKPVSVASVLAGLVSCAVVVVLLYFVYELLGPSALRDVSHLILALLLLTITLGEDFED